MDLLLYTNVIVKLVYWIGPSNAWRSPWYPWFGKVEPLTPELSSNFPDKNPANLFVMNVTSCHDLICFVMAGDATFLKTIVRFVDFENHATLY